MMVGASSNLPLIEYFSMLIQSVPIMFPCISKTWLHFLGQLVLSILIYFEFAFCQLAVIRISTFVQPCHCHCLATQHQFILSFGDFCQPQILRLTPSSLGTWTQEFHHERLQQSGSFLNQMDRFKIAENLHLILQDVPKTIRITITFSTTWEHITDI